MTSNRHRAFERIKPAQRIYQAGCMRTLAGAARSAVKFTVDGRVTENSQTGNALKHNLTQPDGWFSQGVIKFTSGRNAGLSRTVKAHNGNTFEFALRPCSTTASRRVFVYPGTAKWRQDTCKKTNLTTSCIFMSSLCPVCRHGGLRSV